MEPLPPAKASPVGSGARWEGARRGLLQQDALRFCQEWGRGWGVRLEWGCNEEWSINNIGAAGMGLTGEVRSWGREQGSEGGWGGKGAGK